MFKIANILSGLFLLVALLPTPGLAQLQNLGYVVVSPNGPTDGGDFGPMTPGTQTSGIQEAFDFARSNPPAWHREVYIIGGGGSTPVVYDIDTTLNISWSQDWHCDGGNYIMNFTQTTGDCLVIDSQMTSDLKFGSVQALNLQSGSIVKIYPHNVGGDAAVAFGARRITFNSIIGGGGNAVPGKGVGLHIDASVGPIAAPHFYATEIVGCETGILLEPETGGQGILDCVIECPSIRNCNTAIAAHTGFFNRFIASIDPDNVTGTKIGADIAGGYENNYTLSWHGGFSAGNSLKFRNTAKDNLVHAANLPADGVTNNASTKTNRIVTLKPVGFNVTTPAIPTSTIYKTNETSYSIVVTILTPGTVTSWNVKDSSGITDTVSGGLLAGQTIYLEPGDAVRFMYSSPPTWKWRALR